MAQREKSLAGEQRTALLDESDLTQITLYSGKKRPQRCPGGTAEANRHRKTRVLESPVGTTSTRAALPVTEPFQESFSQTQEEWGTECEEEAARVHRGDPVEDFVELGLTEWLANACKSLGMRTPTDIQAGCIPAILAGKDVIGVAQTGSGKTAAFALPILQRLAIDPHGVFALVLTPTRELAFQLAEQFKALGAGMCVRTSVIVGRMDVHRQLKELSSRPHIVVATPGRLKDLVDSDPYLASAFQYNRFLVLDEADRLLDPCFETHLRNLLGFLPANRQTLLFSATMTKTLIRLQNVVLRNAHIYQAYEGLKTVDTLKQQYVFVPAKVKDVYLTYLLEQLDELRIRSAMIFTATCRGCHMLSLLFRQLRITATALHAELPQKRRLSALERFKSGLVPILVATDVASRGLDIPTVDLVINYDLPVMARNYVHRVGRTARAGRGGWALTLVTQYDVELVHKIEGLIGKELEEYEMSEDRVLKLVTKVYTAKKAALLQAAKEEVFKETAGTSSFKNAKMY